MVNDLNYLGESLIGEERRRGNGGDVQDGTEHAFGGRGSRQGALQALEGLVVDIFIHIWVIVCFV